MLGEEKVSGECCTERLKDELGVLWRACRKNYVGRQVGDRRPELLRMRLCYLCYIWRNLF